MGRDFADVAKDLGREAIRQAIYDARAVVVPSVEEPPARKTAQVETGERPNDNGVGGVLPALLPIEWCEEITPRLNSLWLIKRTLPQEGVALIYGHPSSGKSFLALDIAMHVALGWDWNGLRVRKGLVVYIAAEGQNGVRNRIVAFRRRHKQSGEIPFVLVPCPINLHDPATDRIKLASVIRLAAARYGQPPALIVVDTISKTMGAGKENTDDLALYVSNCGWLASEFQCCVMPIHHRPKDRESSDPRGHSSLKAGIDTMILVETGKTRKAKLTKQKDGEERDLLLFRLVAMEIGEDEDGEPVTSCTIEPALNDASASTDPFLLAVAQLRGNQRLVYNQLVSLLAAQGVPVPSAIPDELIDRDRVGDVAPLRSWRDNSISAAGTEAGHSRDTGKHTFNRALRTLSERGIVHVWKEWAWIPHQLQDKPGHGSGQARGRRDRRD